MIKPTKLSKIKGYLTVLGLQEESSSDGFELWEGHGKSVLLCVSESVMPSFSILSMIAELEENQEAFLRITSVIN